MDGQSLLKVEVNRIKEDCSQKKKMMYFLFWLECLQVKITLYFTPLAYIYAKLK